MASCGFSSQWSRYSGCISLVGVIGSGDRVIRYESFRTGNIGNTVRMVVTLWGLAVAYTADHYAILMLVSLLWDHKLD